MCMGKTLEKGVSDKEKSMSEKQLTNWQSVGIGAIVGFVTPFLLAMLYFVAQGDSSLFPVALVAFIIISPFSMGGAFLLGTFLERGRRGAWIGGILGMLLGIGGWILILNSGVINICPLLGGC